MKKYLAEFLGTFALVFFGTGAIIINDLQGDTIGVFGIAVVFGGIVMAMIYSLGDVSGAHINPAVTFAFWLSGRFQFQLMLPYIGSQCVGAISASLLWKVIYPNHETLGATLPAGAWHESFILEIMLTFFLMMVIINVSSGSKEVGMMAGLAIGTIVLIEAAFAGPVTGASMNPARSLGPALVSGNFQYLWIYLTAPIIGSSLGTLACFCMKDNCCKLPSTKN